MGKSSFPLVEMLNISELLSQDFDKKTLEFVTVNRLANSVFISTAIFYHASASYCKEYTRIVVQ